MNTVLNLKQWLKQQPPMSPPQDDFQAIYQQVTTTKPDKKNVLPWILAASLAALTIALVLFNRPLPYMVDDVHQKSLKHLKQQIAALESNLQNTTPISVSHPGSVELEHQVQLEQWLTILNNRLSENKKPQQLHTLLQAKLTVLQSLVPKNQSIQLI